MAIEWLQRTILRRAPFAIHIDDEYDGGADIRVSTGRLVEPDDIAITLLIEEEGDGVYAARIVAQYAPSEDSSSAASYTYREEETVKIAAAGPLMLQTELSYLGGQRPIPPKQLPIGRPVEIADVVAVHNKSFYFELVARNAATHGKNGSTNA